MDFIELPNPKRQVTIGTRMHFKRGDEISEGSALVVAIEGKRVIFDHLPEGIQEGDELISFGAAD
jgi:hypothetical protein